MLRASQLGPAYEEAWRSGRTAPTPKCGSGPRTTDWPDASRRDPVVDLDPVRGSEADKCRPAVIVSNDGANTTAERLGRGVVTVVPVTSNTARVFPFQVFLDVASTGLDRDWKAQAEQVRSVAVERIGARVGALSGDLVAALDEALRLHLAL